MTYQVIRGEYRTEDGANYVGWGIEGGGLRVEDVSTEEADVRALAALLNREGVEPVHLLDIISDFLADFGKENSLLGRAT